VGSGLALDLVAGDRHLGDLARVDLLHELAELEVRLLLLDLGEVPGQEDDDRQRHPEQNVLERGIHFFT
jgi:hypothetical protein